VGRTTAEISAGIAIVGKSSIILMSWVTVVAMSPNLLPVRYPMGSCLICARMRSRISIITA